MVGGGAAWSCNGCHGDELSCEDKKNKKGVMTFYGRWGRENSQLERMATAWQCMRPSTVDRNRQHTHTHTHTHTLTPSLPVSVDPPQSPRLARWAVGPPASPAARLGPGFAGRDWTKPAKKK